MLIIFVLFSLIAIFVSWNNGPVIDYFQKGVLINSVQQNSTMFKEGLRTGMIINEINGMTINDLSDFTNAMNLFSSTNTTSRLDLKTNSIEIIGIFSPKIVNEFSVGSIPKTKIKTGLDIQGGARAVIAAENHSLTDSELQDLIAISQERLNLYGLSDVKIVPQTVLGQKYMVVEIAGSSPSDLENLIAQQGKFEAKIGNETVFVGGEEDITYVA